MSVIKGRDLMVFIDGVSIAYASSHSIEITVDTTEISHKDDLSDWKSSVSQKKSWTASTENLYSFDTDHGVNAQDLFDLLNSETPVEIIFAQKKNPATAQAPFEPTFPEWVGDAIISSLSVSAPNGDNATFTAQFTGVGPLQKATSEAGRKKIEKIKERVAEKEAAKAQATIKE